MNALIKTCLHSSVLLAGLFTATLSHADVNSMTKIYHNPQTAPKVQRCQGNQHCNAFYALSKDWQSIPNHFRLNGFNIKADAKAGDGYGLWKGFNFKSDRALRLAEAGDAVFGGSSNKADERIFAQGLAVLLYLENKK